MKHQITKDQSRPLWLAFQGLTEARPFGQGPKASAKAIKHLGYDQIDTINVIEGSHHYILFSRIPDYKLSHLNQAQSKEKTIFEYWTHSLAYVATDDFKYFINDMNRRKANRSEWYSSVAEKEVKGILATIKKNQENHFNQKAKTWDTLEKIAQAAG